MRGLDRLKFGRRAIPQISTLDDLASLYGDYGLWRQPLFPLQNIQQSLTATATERPATGFSNLANQAFGSNGIVFACMAVRLLVFSSIRFTWQRMRNGAPSDFFSTSALRALERPWPGGTTQDLLARMIQDADLSGNSYWTRQGDELVRLHPEWVEIVAVPRTLGGRTPSHASSARGIGQVGWHKLGYLYTEGGCGSGAEPVPLTVDEVAHFAPIPDPQGVFSGMSWLTPILREIQADQSMTRYKQRFMDNGATPNLIIKHFPGHSPTGQGAASLEQVTRWRQELEDKHAGVDRAGKTLHLYPGADATVVGSNLRDIDLKAVQGHLETRIAAAAGVPPVIAGFSEGLAAATYSNYGQARRRLADGTAHPLWQNVAGSLERIMQSPGNDVRLWYDATDVPFLREDERDAADIAAIKAQTVNSYITAGYEPDSVIAAVDANDLRLLTHSGMYSVQLQQPGTEVPVNSVVSESDVIPN